MPACDCAAQIRVIRGEQFFSRSANSELLDRELHELIAAATYGRYDEARKEMRMNSNGTTAQHYLGYPLLKGGPQGQPVIAPLKFAVSSSLMLATMHAPEPIPAPRVDGMSASTPVPLYWREDGPASASPLVLLHGGPGAHHDYLYPQMLALAASHRLFTYDQRGGGRSRTTDSEPITWRTHTHDLGNIVTEFGCVPPTLVGYSWGGLLAMLYAIEAQKHATLPLPERLVLVSPAPITREWRDEFETTFAERQRAPAITALRAELAASGLRESDVLAFRQRSFELSVAGYFADPRQARALTPFRVLQRVQQSVWDSLGDFDLRADLHDVARAVHLPVVVVHGSEDPIPLASSQAAAEALNAELVVLPDCGHVPYVEQPAALFDVITRFLSS